jgi:hypothetical protein
MYQDPYVFNPDRILLDGELHPAGKLPEIAFGYGRRYALIIDHIPGQSKSVESAPADML